MSEILSGAFIPKALNHDQNQVQSLLKKHSVNQNYKSAASNIEAKQSVFNRIDGNFSSVGQNYLGKLFEKAITDDMIKSLQKDLGILRVKSRIFENSQNATTKNFVKHQQEVRANPEIAAIETKITSNNSKIQKKQAELAQKPMTQANQKAMDASVSINAEISGLRATEFSITADISAIKAQIQQIKSGKISVFDLVSTSSIDMGSLIKTNSSSGAIIGGQQISENEQIRNAMESLKAATNSGSRQKEIENLIKKSIISILEGLLSVKEDELSRTRKQINQKQNELSENQNNINSLNSSQSVGTDSRESLEEEIEALIKETLALIEQRHTLDPTIRIFASVSNFFNNFLKGSGSTGIGINPQIERKTDDYENIRKINDEKTEKVNDYSYIFNVNSTLRDYAKTNLENSKSYTEEQRKLFDSFNQKYAS